MVPANNEKNDKENVIMIVQVAQQSWVHNDSQTQIVPPPNIGTNENRNDNRAKCPQQ